jgi:hypothetical protein
MMMRIFSLKALSLLILWLGMAAGLQGASAQELTFRASVDRTSLTVNDLLTYTLEIQGSAMSLPDPRLPDFQNFSIISGPNQSSTFQFINGRTSYSKTLSFVLRPLQTGNLTIGSAELTYKRQTYRTDPITVSVAGSGSAPPPQTAAPAPPPAPTPTAESSDLFVQVTADKNQLYQGEQVVLTYTIYTRLAVNSYEISKLPATPGFWMEEFDAPQGGAQVRDVTYAGKHYRAAVIRRVALFPARSGELSVDPLEVTCQVQVQDLRRRSRDPFDMFFNDPFSRFRTEQRVIQTNPLKLKVLPLPAEGKPADFDGAVGNFDLEVSLDRNQAKTNEALTMTVRFSGAGNIKMLPAPAFKAPSDFETYAPKETVSVNKSGARISGVKTFEYVLIPRFAGDRKIPPITFSYFNPATKSYQTLSKGGFDVVIEQGSGTTPIAATGIAKEDVKLLGQDIRYLKTPKKLHPVASAGKLPASLWLSIWMPPLLSMLLLGSLRLLGLPSLQARLRGRRAYARARSELAALGRLASSGPAVKNRFARFYGGLHRLLLDYLSWKLNLPAKGLKEEEVLERLAERNLPAEPLSELREIFNTCNYARFTPENQDASRMDRILKQARQIVDWLESNWEKSS